MFSAASWDQSLSTHSSTVAWSLWFRRLERVALGGMTLWGARGTSATVGFGAAACWAAAEVRDRGIYRYCSTESESTKH